MFSAGRWLLPLFWLISNATCWINGARILVIAPFETHSQCLLLMPYIEALAERGHQLTVIHAFKHCKPVGNETYIRISDNNNVFAEFEEFMVYATTNKWEEMNSMARIMINAGLNVLNNAEVRALMKSNTTFDAVVVEAGFTDVLFGLGELFNATLIGISTCGADWNLNTLVGHGVSVLVEPLMPMSAIPVRNVWDRIYMWYYNTEEWLLLNLVFIPKLRLVHDHFFGHLKKSFVETRQGFSLMLLNQHFSLFRARSSVPGMIEVGGFHIPKMDPTLPEDLQIFIDEAEHGVIYFALGVELQSRDLPQEFQKMLLKIFASLPQRVIWKFEGKHPANVSNNVYLSKMLPQQAILAHPNVKVFISHGGMLSIFEAVYYGKNIIGLPLFYDQFRNLEVLVEEEVAIELRINSMTEEVMRDSLDRLLYQPKYREKARSISEKFRDQPMHPLDSAIYWTEYVIRYKGAKHMRVSQSQVKLAEYYSLDKFLMVGVRLFLVVVFVFFALSNRMVFLNYLARFVKSFIPVIGIQRNVEVIR
ncbi:UDP-glycosyltransferase UGT5 [Drosophila ficusphila]|uniref:UDP-glycosyltransferase UGT5 n=1 Tax=Drosophila ficusphila TaxID=30025 RepID=UPI0007E5D5E4|nr:UDP-glycosyltransferase UGT5 [Drosophila ficusphila]